MRYKGCLRFQQDGVAERNCGKGWPLRIMGNGLGENGHGTCPAPWRREGPPDLIKNPPTDTAGACMETESGTACVSYKHRPADRVRVAQKKECPIDMITNVRTYGHRTGMCMHSHKLRATEIPVTADNMGWSSK